jgi:hypothetical protein
MAVSATFELVVEVLIGVRDFTVIAHEVTAPDEGVAVVTFWAFPVISTELVEICLGLPFDMHCR